MIDGVDWLPIRLGRTTQRVHTQLQAGAADRLHIDDVAQVLDIGQDEVLLVSRLSFEGGSKWHAFYARSVAQQLIGAAFNQSCYVGVSGPTIGRVVFEAAVRRRIVRRRNDDPVGQMIFTIPIINENGSRDDRRGGEAVV